MSLSAQKELTKAQLKALRTAVSRERGNICPTIGLHAAASDQLVAALDRKGFITWDGLAPRINEVGRAALRQAVEDFLR